MQLTPYAELLKINKQKQRGLLKIAELEEKINTLEDTVVSLCSQTELNFEAIVDKQDELALALRRKEQFSTVINQLFPTNEA